jgi:hypothetical protein
MSREIEVRGVLTDDASGGEPSQPSVLPVACGVLACIVAGIHLYWGLPRFAVYVTVGTMADPRPLAFVLSSHAILFGLTLVGLGVISWDRLVLPGIGLMGIHLVGYAAWHTILSHGVRGAGGTAHDHVHAADIVATTVTHLVNSPMVLAAKSAEVALLVGLLVSYRRRQLAS